MLGLGEIAGYLLERKLITAESVLAEAVTLRATPGRNSNVHVSADAGASYFIKQGVDRVGRTSVRREAEIYGLLHHSAKALQPFLLSSDFDRQTGLLILESHADVTNAREHQLRNGRFSTVLAGRMGRAIAALHLATPALSRGARSLELLDNEPPWALTIHTPRLAMVRETSQANLELLRMIQSHPAMCERLDEIRDAWRGECFVHNDVKWDNWLLCGRRASSPLKLLDWEFSGLGEAHWDTGSCLASYLALWVFSVPITGEDPPKRFAELARYPLAKLQPAMRAFWRAYVDSAGLDVFASSVALLAATSYCGVRLLQTAFEHLHESPSISGSAVLLLQLGCNVLLRPLEAAQHLLGISLDVVPDEFIPR